MGIITVLGVDPGIRGAIARATYDSESCKVEDVVCARLPTIGIKSKAGRNQQHLDTDSLSQLLRDWVSSRSSVAFVEDVHSMPNQGVVSMFRFGEAKGIVLGILSALFCRCIPIGPRQWKKKLGLTKDKADSVLLAKKLYPDCVISNHNNAEALLLLHYGITECSGLLTDDKCTV